MSSPLTHFDAQGQAHMVDISGKSETRRIARATGMIRMQPATLAAIAGVFLAWASAAGYLPATFTNAPAYLALAAGAEAAVVAYGLASIGSGMQREAFGYRQVAAGVVALLLAGGLVGRPFFQHLVP